MRILEETLLDPELIRGLALRESSIILFGNRDWKKLAILFRKRLFVNQERVFELIVGSLDTRIT
jgi:hypothetical protein